MHMYLGHGLMMMGIGFELEDHTTHDLFFCRFSQLKIALFCVLSFQKSYICLCTPTHTKPPHLFSHASMCSHLRSHLLLSLFWASYYLYRALGRTPVRPIYLLDLIARINPLLPFFFFCLAH